MNYLHDNETDEEIRAEMVCDLHADTIAEYETMSDGVMIGPLKLDTLDDFAIALGFC